ncbi:hypothetical protein ACG3SL_01325 [Sphingomonas sp. CJ20]
MGISARQRRIWIAAAATVLAAALGGVLIGLGPRYLPAPGAGVFAAIVLAGAFLAMLPRWRALDHMQKDSRLISWYWGGGFGGGLGLVLAAVLAGTRSPLFAGAALVWLLQFLGYALARLNWWLAHRADAA